MIDSFVVPPPPAFGDIASSASNIGQSPALLPPLPTSSSSSSSHLPMPVDISAIDVPIQDILEARDAFATTFVEQSADASKLDHLPGAAPLHSTLLLPLLAPQSDESKSLVSGRADEEPRKLAIVDGKGITDEDGESYETSDDPSLIVTSFTPSPTAPSSRLAHRHGADEDSRIITASALPPPALQSPFTPERSHHPVPHNALSPNAAVLEQAKMILPPTPFRSFSTVTSPLKKPSPPPPSNQPLTASPAPISPRGPEEEKSPGNSAAAASPRIPHVPPSRGLLARRPVLMSRRSRSLPTLVGIEKFCSGDLMWASGRVGSCHSGTHCCGVESCRGACCWVDC